MLFEKFSMEKYCYQKNFFNGKILLSKNFSWKNIVIEIFSIENFELSKNFLQKILR